MMKVRDTYLVSKKYYYYLLAIFQHSCDNPIKNKSKLGWHRGSVFCMNGYIYKDQNDSKIKKNFVNT